MILIPLLTLLAGSWSGTFNFDEPVEAADGTPLVQGTVNMDEPGFPVYPVTTVFVPVPGGAEPVLDYSSVGSRSRGIAVPRAPMLVGSGLDAVELEAPASDRPIASAELRGVFPLAGTTVAAVDIHPLTQSGFSSQVNVSLSWNGGGRGVPIPEGHALNGLVQGEVYWPNTPDRAESPFWGKPWARISIQDSGGYRITRQELENAGCGVTGAPVQSLALYSGPGIQFDDAPETQHSLEEVAVVVEDDGNGIFDGDDSLIFLAGGLNRFEIIGGDLRWLWHRYARERVYWLTWGGMDGSRMETVSGAPDGSPDWGGSMNHVVHLEDGGYWKPRWENRTGWFWDRLDNDDSVSIPVDIGYAAGEAEVTLAFAVSEAAPYLVGLQGYGSVQLSGTGRAEATFSQVEISSIDQLVVSFSSDDPGADMYLDYVEISFPAQMTSSGRRLFPGAEGRFTMSVTGGEMAFDLTDPMDPVRITGGSQGSGSLVFSHTLTDSSSIMVLGDGDWDTPAGISSASPGRLVGTVTSGDRLLVVPPEFADDAAALKALLGEMGYSVVAATTQEIYDEFGQGVKDPGAIRSAVRWGLDSWASPLGAVILCGDGHYDPLGYATTNPDLVPAMIYPVNNQYYPAWAFEDWFVQVHENSFYPEIPVARVPAGNAAAFSAVLAKSAVYASGAAGGDWSSRWILFADDEWGQNSSCNEWDHTTNLETICYDHLPSFAKPEKFYLVEYPWPQGTTPQSVHPEKPEARTDFMELWNRGAGALLYMGHGSANQLAHEKVMLGEDPFTLENRSRLPFAMFMSCDVSRFFVPGVDCISEKVVYHAGGGAIASVGATGGTTSGLNRSFAQSLVSNLYQGEDRSLGHAFWMAKLEAARASNSDYYVFLGIPDLTLTGGMQEIEVELAGDTLFSGETNQVSGTGVSREGLTLVEITESDIPWQYVMLGGLELDYLRQGGTAWRGRQPLSDGSFTVDCIIPASSSTGDLARIDAASVVPSGVEIGAAAPVPLVQGDPPADYEGPEMEMWISGQRDSETPVITGEGSLEAELSDPSGINFLGRSGNSIQLFVDDQEFDLSDRFSYNTGSTVTGQLQYTVSGLSTGEHRFILRARDGVGNLSSDTLFVTSTDQGDVSIQEHLVYPNPGTGTRCFSFSVSTTSQVEVSIFTTAGRCIRRLSRLCPQGYNQIIWDGLDADGDIPASGSYIYMIEAQTESGLFTQSSSVTGVIATVN